MPRIIKNTLLNYISKDFAPENTINTARIYEINKKTIKKGIILYLCEREIRAKDNFALQFALQKQKEFNLPLKIIHPQINYEYAAKQIFLNRQIQKAKKLFDNSNLDFEIINKSPLEIIKKINPAILIIDFNPISKRDYLKELSCKIFEIDGHNIIPARFLSNKLEYNAATIRSKIYHNYYPFLTEFNNITEEKVDADYVLIDFIKNKLQHYAKSKNNPSTNVLSGLSKYLNLGFISSQRIAIEVIKSNISKENIETFLEEVIIRKELADNFCLYAKNFQDLSNIPNWAKLSLKEHKYDIRPYIYSSAELEKAKTHDELWNCTQIQLIREGTIHGYLRMYWAKKILEWTNTVEKALKTTIYLNDKYAYDAPSPNGYVGILWALCGLHDRAFRDYPLTGKIRRMTYESIKRKYNLSGYVKKINLI